MKRSSHLDIIAQLSLDYRWTCRTLGIEEVMLQLALNGFHRLSMFDYGRIQRTSGGRTYELQESCESAPRSHTNSNQHYFVAGSSYGVRMPLCEKHHSLPRGDSLSCRSLAICLQHGRAHRFERQGRFQGRLSQGTCSDYSPGALLLCEKPQICPKNLRQGR